MYIGTPPPPQNVTYKRKAGGGGCVKGVGYGYYEKNLITPTYGKVGDF